MNARRASALCVIAVLAATGSAQAAEEISWARTPPASGKVVGGEVELTGPGSFRLLTLENPGIRTNRYAVTGRVRYSGVEGAGLLEMWSHFANGNAYYSRTLAGKGPMAVLNGDSAGRDFELPFTAGDQRPMRLIINVVLPAKGSVWVGPLRLEQRANSWWNQPTAGRIGALLGGLGGLLGATVGMLAGRQRAKRTVAGLMLAGIVSGLVALLAGVAAILSDQPQHVWYPLLLVGVILTAVFGSLLGVVKRRYAAVELQRMRALDQT